MTETQQVSWAWRLLHKVSGSRMVIIVSDRLVTGVVLRNPTTLFGRITDLAADEDAALALASEETNRLEGRGYVSDSDLICFMADPLVAGDPITVKSPVVVAALEALS